LLEALTGASTSVSGAHSGRSPRVRPRRVNPGRPEGRWSCLEASETTEETQRQAWVEALLYRYGVVTRELVELDPWAPAWAELAPLLARAELRGEIRRGYFVEGFSGVQYCDTDAAEELTRLASATTTATSDVLLSAGDPANLYGSGAPLDIPLLDGGTARLSRIPGNYLVVRGGRPVLVVEAHGKRLTGLASASPAELDAALARVVELARSDRHILKVETYNGEPCLTSAIAQRLAELGFVRDYPGMTYYPLWAPPPPSDASVGVLNG
jgi:ATP-dependent Lhr-like helicase